MSNRRSPLSAFLILVLALAVPAAATSASTADGTPRYQPQSTETITVQASAVDAEGTPLAGTQTVDLLVLEAKSERELARERHTTEFENGRFSVELGSETNPEGKKPGLLRVFAEHPELRVRVTIAGVRQYPDMTILPAGHSPANVDAAAGAAPLTGPTTKGYAAAARGSSVQSTVFSPVVGSGQEQTVDARGRTVYRRPFQIEAVRLGESRPVRSLPPADRSREGQEPVREVNRPRHGDLFAEDGRRYGTGIALEDDALALRSQTARSTSPAPPLILDFAGVPNVSGVLPPDTEGAVGNDHYVHVVNSAFAIYDKAGSQLVAPVNTNTLWSGFGGPCQTDNAGDAIFLYDQEADRWVLTQFLGPSTGNAVCFAVSTTDDPTGTYSLYQINTQRFPDYFKIGVWPDPNNNAYFLTTNSGFAGQYDIYAIDRERMLSGSAIRPTQFFQNFPNLFMPADLDGHLPAGMPPAGTPGLFYTFLDGGETYFGNPPPAADSIEIYEYAVDWATPGNSTFTQAQSLTNASGSLTDFNWTVCGFFVSNCLPQPDTAQGIDSASWWPMQRLVYRNFGTHESLVGAWTVNVMASQPGTAAPRWFELRRSGARGGWSIHQEGTHNPNDPDVLETEHRFMPSIAMDRKGNVAMGYSITADDLHPSIRYAVNRVGTDAPGVMGDEGTLIAGTGSQTSSAARWGDYASMELDPVDDCTFWFTSEYLATTGGAPWLTRVGTFRVPQCLFMLAEPRTLEVCTTAGSVDFEIDLVDGGFNAGAVTVGVEAGDCPSGASCSVTPPAPTTTTDATVTVSSLGSASEGVYPIRINGSQAALNDQIELVLSLFDTEPSAFSLSAPADSATEIPTAGAEFSWTSTNASSYTVEVSESAAFTTIAAQRTTTATSATLDLNSGTEYYWRVRANNACGDELSPVRSFTTATAPGDCPVGQVASAFYSDDMESGAVGWGRDGSGDPWALWSDLVNSGSNAWHSDGLASAAVDNLNSPSVAIPAGAVQPLLRFWHYQSMEDNISGSLCFDGGVLEKRVNGGSWAPVPDSEIISGGYKAPISNLFSNPLGGTDAWCGDPTPWSEVVVDLDGNQGDSVEFRFRLATDSSVVRDGWTIDDVSLTQCVVATPPIFEDGFESGDTTAWSP